MPKRVAVVGSANADLVVRVERHPEVGETVHGSDIVVHPGGKGANQAVAAARLGADVAFVGRVGSDPYGEFLGDALRRDGVDLAGLRRSDGASGAALIAVGPDGDNTIVVSPGANGRVGPGDVAAAGAIIADAAVVSLQLEIPLPAVLAAARAARRLVFNPSPPGPVPDELLALCDPLVVNEHEAARLLGRAMPRSMEEAAAALLARGPRSAIVTLGADGAIAAEAGSTRHLPSPKVDPVDTTGAGDAFTGALAWRLAEGDALADAAAFATRVGAFAVTREGAQDSYPRMEDLP
ncbi:ribokinase [Glycomyces salinus]|uniref:ribokinase n=1 Tax=Glycomyces salinus TaxID=980294 RepID=UPI0018EB3969|nr:ribokinase [Glycomyces salinus]